MNANLIQLLLRASENGTEIDIKLNNGDVVTGLITFSKKQIEVGGVLCNIGDISEIHEHLDNSIITKLEEYLSERVYLRLEGNDIISGFLLDKNDEEIELVTAENQISIPIDIIEEISDEPILLSVEEVSKDDMKVDEVASDISSNERYPYGGFEAKLFEQQCIPAEIKSTCLEKFEANEYSEALKILSGCVVTEDNSKILEELLDYLQGVVDRYEDKGSTYKKEYGYCYHGSLSGVIEQNALKAVSLYKKEIEPWGDYGPLALCCSLNTVLRIGSNELMHKTALDLEKHVSKIDAVSGTYSQAQAYKTILLILLRVEDWEEFNACLQSLINALSEDGHSIAANNARYKYARILMENEKYEYAEKYYLDLINEGDIERALFMLMHCIYVHYGEELFEENIKKYILNDSIDGIWKCIRDKYFKQYCSTTSKLEYLDRIISKEFDDKGLQAEPNEEKQKQTSEKSDGNDIIGKVISFTNEEIEDEWEDSFSNYRKSGQLPAARKYFKKKTAQYPNSEYLKLINHRIELWQAQFGSYKSIGKPSSDYERGMQKWFSERSNNEAASMFMVSINSSDSDRTTALLAFMDFSAVEYGFDQALGNLPILRPIVREMDKRMKITFYEKVYSFAYFAKDNGEALSALNSLQNLYFSKSQLGKTEYRIAGIYYLQGKWARAKEHLEKTIQYAYNLENTRRMIKYCENCLQGNKPVSFEFEGESNIEIDITRINSELQNYYNNVQYEEARKYIRNIYESNSNDENIARIKDTVEKIVENLNNYSSGIPKKSDNASRAWRAWHIEEDYAKAERCYRKEMNAKGPKYLSCLFDLAEMLMHVKGNSFGIACLKENEAYIITIDKTKQASFYEKLNVMLQKSEDYEERKECLEKLLKINKELGIKEKVAFTYFRLGVLAFGYKEYDAAVAYMEEAVNRKYGAVAVCYQYIVTSLIKSGKDQDALAYADRLLKEDLASQDNNFNAFLQQTIEKIKSPQNSSEQNKEANEEDDEHIFDFLFEPNDKLIMYLLNNQLIKHQIDTDNGEPQQKLQTYKKRINELKGTFLATNFHKLAIMENELNGQTSYFYSYLDWCVKLYARDTYKRRNYDSSVLWYVYMLNNAQNKSKDIQNLKEYTNNILKCAIKDTVIKDDTEVAELIARIFASENENAEYAFRLLVFAISKSFVLNDIENGEFKKFIEMPGNETCGEQIARFINISNREQLDYTSLIKHIQQRVSTDTYYIQTLINKFRSSKSFNEEYVDELRKLRDMIFVFEEDVNYINEFIDIYEKALEIYEYPDYDNRIATIRTVQDRLFEINNRVDDKPTYFSIYYLCDMLDAMLSLLSIVSDTTIQELAPELYITVPITEIETVDNQNLISITVSNKENSAIATSLFVSLFDSEGNSLLENGSVELAPYLKGGASKSIELDIETQATDTFSIKIQVQYKNHKDEICTCEQDESISTVSSTYEEIVGNPYVDGKALDPQKNRNVFMGRDVLLGELETSLVDDSGQCVIIYGQKRCGKTSISNFLQERIRDKFVIISFSAGSAISASQLYNNVRTKFMLELMKMIHSKDAELPEYEREILLSLHSELSKMDVSNGEAFIDMMRVIYGQYCLMKDQELLIIIDEFTHLYRLYQKGENERGEVTAFMDTWKKGSEEKLFKSLLIGQDTMPYIMAAYPNQLAITDPRRVDRLDEESVRQLIEKPILLSDGNSRYMEKSIDLIANWFYGQPYYISVYCKRMVEHMKATHKNYVTNAMAEKIKNEMLLSSTISFFDNLINAGDIDMTSEADLRNLPAYKLLYNIAYLTKNSEWANIEDIDIQDKDKLIEDLINRSVIERRKGRCRIYINFFKEWLNIYGRD